MRWLKNALGCLHLASCNWRLKWLPDAGNLQKEDQNHDKYQASNQEPAANSQWHLLIQRFQPLVYSASSQQPTTSSK
jgi:hypothetical protein